MVRLAYSSAGSCPRATFSDENTSACPDIKREVPQTPSAVRMMSVTAKIAFGVFISKAASILKPSMNPGAKNLVVVDVMIQMVAVKRIKRPAA